MKRFAATMMALALGITNAAAQDTTRDQPREQANNPQAQSRASRQTADQNLDSQIAACLLLGNQEEVALAQYAQQHAQNDQVKQFAKMLAEQHSKAVTAIQDAAPDIAELKLVTNEVGATALDRSSSSSVGGAAGSNPSIAMVQMVKSECLKLTLKELRQYQGAEFDKAYVGQQLGAHLGMLAQLRGSKTFASPELQKTIAEGEKMTVAHMEQAKKIMDQIKDEGNKTASARPINNATKR